MSAKAKPKIVPAMLKNDPECEVCRIVDKMEQLAKDLEPAALASQINQDDEDANLPLDWEDLMRLRQHHEDRLSLLRWQVSFATCNSMRGAIYLLTAVQQSDHHAHFQPGLNRDSDGDRMIKCYAEQTADRYSRRSERMRFQAFKYIRENCPDVSIAALCELTDSAEPKYEEGLHEPHMLARVQKAMEARAAA